MAQRSLLFLVLALCFCSSWAQKSCKCFYGDSCFPNQAVWSFFNRSIGGRLLTPHPTAYFCHDPNYDEQACNEAKKNWTDSLWRSQHVGALELPQFEAHGNESCLISTSRETPCSQGSVPVYAVNVSQVAEVQAAVNFARFHNLRLVIKNTGHDYYGKSTGRGALSLWMHNIKGITFFQHRSICNPHAPAVSAVRVGAGVQFRELNSAATKHNVVVVGALSASVGAAGGWFQGAGHSSLSPHFGLGSDNVLEIELVTAAGEHIVANECINHDLFWAMRGGGGGTFGVVLSVTYATHPAPSKALGTSIAISANDTSSFRELLTVFTRIHPNLTDSGYSGSFDLASNLLIINYLALDEQPSFVNATMKPLLDLISDRPGLSILRWVIKTFATYEDWFTYRLCVTYNNLDDGICVDSVGNNRALGSRLIPRSKLEQSPEEVADMLINVINAPGISPSILGLCVAGGAVSTSKSVNAVNPAWRNAIWHLVISVDAPDGASAQEKHVEGQAVTAATKIMEDAAPDSGAYLNEADFNQPEWQATFYGEHYTALKSIKDARDPTGLFLCHHCVGSEDWRYDFSCPLSDDV